ncbi:MAG: FliG C-terminal domain-containing protein, partial [Paracoccus sp. (in: a-proteobacteria)]|nr:FliG C-terminal domain-containing protein [Paracoccus sp. (in: a-proteobacteria)]
MDVIPMLNQRQKAAVIVRLMLENSEDLALGDLAPDTQAALAHEMAVMGVVDRESCDQIVQEFCDALEQVGVTFPGGLDGTLSMLGDTISREITDRLRRMAALAGDADPWERISAMPARQLAELAALESTEVAAVMFARLPVSKAAEAFGLMPAARARQIAFGMSMTGGIEDAALRRIGLALMQAADGLARPAIDAGPVEKVGEILNFSPAGTRDEVLVGLDADDPDFAAEVRRAIFTWAGIPRRIDPRDIPRILREADPLALTRAMSGAKDADKKTADFILSCLSTRMADSLRDEIEAAGRISAKDCEEAMASIVATIRTMEEAGDLFLIAMDAEDDADPASVEMKT